jgi:hypothetical protein
VGGGLRRGLGLVGQDGTVQYLDVFLFLRRAFFFMSKVEVVRVERYASPKSIFSTAALPV